MQDGYYRFPTVYQDSVVFVSEDDLWQVPITGGLARRLTTGLGSISHPHFSRDGRQIAFIGKEEGDPDVYVMSSQGGPIRRLTYLGSGAAIVGWHPDGRIIFSTYYGKPFLAWRSLYAVPPEGGEPEELPFGRASWVSFGPEGRIVLGRPATDSSRWKRYRGGTRGVLWIDQKADGQFTRYAREDSNLVMPLWINDRIYFISDHEDHANLYSMNPDGQDMRRHTQHEDYYIRHLDSSGQNLVYAAGGDLYRYNLRQESSQKIEIAFHSQRTGREVKHVNAADYWSEYTFSGKNDSLLITTRGKLFHLDPFVGPIQPLGVSQGVRYRLAQSIDSEQYLTVSDEGGEDHLEIRQIGSEPVEAVTRIPVHVGIVEEIKCAPNGQFAVFSTERQDLWLLDLKTLDLTLIAHTDRDHIAGFDWAPDSRWIAYALPGRYTTPLYLYELATKLSHQITQPVLTDRRPVFDPAGRYLYFLSKRVFKPVLDHMKFERSFPKGEIPCLITLAKDTTSPFIPKPKPLVPPKATGDEAPGSESVTTIDLENIDERILAFPVKEAIFHDIQAGHDRVFWTKSEPRAEVEEDDVFGQPPAYAELVQYDWANLKEESLHSHVTSFTLSKDRKVMAIRIRSELRVIEAGHKVDAKENKPGRQSGLVDFKRIHVRIEQLAEWYQMQRDTWRQMREIFWVADMGGVDWDNVYDRYRALIPRITTRSELADLLWEMQAELGSSHAYEYGGHYRTEPRHKIGFLGASYRFSQDDNGYRVTHLVHGDSANPDTQSPLLTPGVNIQVGTIITAINGEPLGPDIPPGARLMDTVGQDVSLSLRDGSGTRTVTVRPVASETPARYREWVKTNRRTVHEKTNGRVGYIHIPNMVNTGFGEFHRSYLAEYERDGLIVDVRYNSGGIVSPLILEILNRKRIAFTKWRGGFLQAYPYESPTGAMVAITNELAGSDGDIFSHNFKLMQLGPLIGTRTWGGVIGIGPRYPLVDWTTVTQPEMAFWFKDVGLGVENYGTDPDIPVEETPQAMARGVDEQLERAIAEILKILSDFHPLVPNYENRPHHQPKPLH